MTIQIDWPSEVLLRVKQAARARGLPLNEYLLQCVLQAAVEENDGISRQQAAESIRRLRAGTRLGSEDSLRELVKEGRRF